MVVMVPLTILKLSCTTLAIGDRQFVVQEALETIWCLAGSYLSWLTPSTMVTSSFFAGAVMMIFFTGPRMCFLASLASVKRPVDSITTCAPTEAQSSWAGRSEEHTSELQSRQYLVCRLLLEKKKKKQKKL